MTRRRRTGMLTLPLVATLTAIAACASPIEEARDESAPDLERFTSQTLRFAECPPDLAGLPAELAPLSECATLTVPIDYQDPSGETLDLGVLRVRALGGEAIGSLVTNPGGPGYAGMGYGAAFAAMWAETPVAQSFDVVGFDPRGVGTSEPRIDCYTDAQREDDAMTAALPSGERSWTRESTREVMAQCAEGVGGEDVLAHLGTRDAARDLDVLRAALGDEQLTFAGSSYGSRLGAVYAEMYPENVRAIVLDAAVDPTKNTAERLVQQNDAAHAAFDRLAAFCATQADCPLGTDPDRAAERSQEILQPLVDDPLVTADGREVTFYKALNAVISALYVESAWPSAIAAYAELAAGRGDTALALNDAYAERSPDGVYADSHEATFAINCMDEERLSGEEATELLARMNADAPAFAPGVDVETLSGCDAWPAEPTLGFPYADDIAGLPETLVVSVTGDAITPHEGGIHLAETLGARLFTVEGEQHGALVLPGPCVSEAVSAYLVELTLPAEGAVCSV